MLLFYSPLVTMRAHRYNKIYERKIPGTGLQGKH